MRYRLIPLSLLVFLTTFAGCAHSPYAITFNDNVIYTPNNSGRPGNSVFVDAGLEACVNQIQLANPEIQLDEIKLLACPEADIQSLEGIAALSALEQLELSNNSISNLAPMANLRNLRVLGIRNNDLSNIGILESLPILRFVSLQGNDKVSCRQLDSLQDKLGNTLIRPLTCIP